MTRRIKLIPSISTYLYGNFFKKKAFSKINISKTCIIFNLPVSYETYLVMN